MLSGTLLHAIRYRTGTFRSAQSNGISSAILFTHLVNEFHPTRFLLQSKNESLPWGLEELNDSSINQKVSSVLVRLWSVVISLIIRTQHTFHAFEFRNVLKTNPSLLCALFQNIKSSLEKIILSRTLIFIQSSVFHFAKYLDELICKKIKVTYVRN